MEKCLMDVVTPLIANREPAVLRKPAQCALHNPPVSPQLLAALNSLSCYPAPDGTLPEGFFALFVVVSFVSVKFLGPLSRSATGSLDGLYAVDQLFENHRVVDVCRAELHTERDASSVRNNMALRARFSFICRIRSGFWAPLLAGMEAESKQARFHSIWSASPRRFKSTRCRRSQSPASCHSRNRRQHVTPEPQPISWGNISQGMPLFSTKMMPVRAARSSTRGLPPCGLGDSGGSSSSITSHSSSLTNSLAIFSTYPDPVVLKGSLSSSTEVTTVARGYPPRIARGLGSLCRRTARSAHRQLRSSAALRPPSPTTLGCASYAPPFTKGGVISPATLINAPTLATGDEFPVNSWPTSENSPSTHLGE